MEENNNKELVEDILNKAKNDIIIVMTSEGAVFEKLENFVQQPVDGILYDLNRDFATLSSFAENSKNLRFVNDFACANVIKYLYNKVCCLEKEMKTLKDINSSNNKPKTNVHTTILQKSKADSLQEGFNTSLEINM